MPPRPVAQCRGGPPGLRGTESTVSFAAESVHIQVRTQSTGSPGHGSWPSQNEGNLTLGGESGSIMMYRDAYYYYY